MKSAAEIVFEAQAILGALLTPGIMSDREALEWLVEILEGPDAIGLAIAHERMPAESQAQMEVVRFLARKAVGSRPHH
jgi:hypothetical protein